MATPVYKNAMLGLGFGSAFLRSWTVDGVERFAYAALQTGPMDSDVYATPAEAAVVADRARTFFDRLVPGWYPPGAGQIVDMANSLNSTLCNLTAPTLTPATFYVVLGHSARYVSVEATPLTPPALLFGSLPPSGAQQSFITAYATYAAALGGFTLNVGAVQRGLAPGMLGGLVMPAGIIIGTQA